MSDADDQANLTVRRSLQVQLVQKGATPERAVERADEKIAASKKWWTFATIALLGALAFLIAGFTVVVKIALATHAIPIVLAIALGTPAAVLVVVAVFCASEADPDATHAFFDNLLAFRKSV